MLKNIFADVYHLQKMFNVYLQYIPYRREYIHCKWLINILFAICKLSVWISVSCWNVAKKFNHLVCDVFHIAENISFANVSNVLKSVWSEFTLNERSEFTLIEWKYFTLTFVMLKKKNVQWKKKYFRCSCSTAARLPSPK